MKGFGQMPKWRPISEAVMTERSLLDRLPNYDHDYDGRPPVGYWDDDPLLEALIREHPELIPKELAGRVAAAVHRASVRATIPAS
jgi:hypothetical protein